MTIMRAAAASTIVTGTQARELMLRALRMGVRAIGTSLGPYGRGLMFDGGSGGPLYSRSGLDIARRVTGESGAGSVALRILRDVLWQVKRDIGDGTSRTTCIAVAVYAEAAKCVASGIAPALLNNALQQLQTELPSIVDAQRRHAPDASGFEIAQSACMDHDLARAIGDAYAQMPERGAIDVQPGKEPEIRLERYSGFCLDVQPEAMGASVEEQGLRVELEAAYVLVVNEVIGDFGPLARVLDMFAQSSKSLVIVARGFEGAARATLNVNRESLRMHVLGLVPAEVGVQAMHVLDDLCAATGATVISEDTGISMAAIRPSMSGFASRLVVERGRAIFSGATGNPDAIRMRRDLLAAQTQAQRYLALDREKLQRRAARLAGNWAVLRVGAHTQWETEQRVEAGIAALAALEASSSSGVVDGAGRALFQVADSLMQLRGESASDVRRAAIECVASGCRAVTAQLAANAGGETVEAERSWRVVDPLSSTVSILQHAVSAAATLLTVEVLIC